MRRLEQRFYLPESMEPCAAVAAAGLEASWAREEVDTHFCSRDGALWLRVAEGDGELLFARRLSTPLPKEGFAQVTPSTDGLREILTQALGVRTTVRKQRRRFEGVFSGHRCTADVDTVEGLGRFVEIGVPLEDHSSDAAAAVLGALTTRLGLSSADALPYTYADLAVMLEASRRYRERLASAGRPVGRMVILDGASCSGKTTLGNWLLEEADAGLELVPRYTTRAPRPEEEGGSEYLFTTPAALHRLTQAGELFEYRDFEFGMSYGLPWKLAVERLQTGRSGLGIMNLGNVRHVKRVFPEATTILIHAPIEVIERRLRDRGMPEGHIAERLGNARRVESYREFYDHVVENDDGRLEDAKAELVRITGVVAPG